MKLVSGAHPDWLAWHVFYHEDRELMLREMVRPLVADLNEKGLIERFFFIRYPLGGSHLRLRFRPRGAVRAEMEEIVTAYCERFFAAHPPETPRDDEQIREDNKVIISQDPAVSDIEVYADCSCPYFDFEPEVERYGGLEHLDASLDFFAVSSRRALDFSVSHGTRPKSRQFPAMLCLLVQQAFGFARSADEMADLLTYPMEVLGGTPDNPLVIKADKIFEAQADTFGKLLAFELEALLDAEPALGASDDAAFCEQRSLAEASYALSDAIASAPSRSRRSIGSSQMHMTANRLGVSNPEELYLSRLMERASEHVAANRPELWQRAVAAMEGRPDPKPSRAAAKLAAAAQAAGDQLSIPDPSLTSV